MTATGWLVLGGIALIFAWAIAVLLFEVAAKWALDRQAERTAAATFERDFVPESDEVAATERELPDPRNALLEVAIIAELDQVDMERRRINAEVTKWVAS